ncbi:MAG TPA: peptidylprolyl isomerase [Candidatus Limnocylindria bacterium]|jgi:parvulin-like peptidyl-prolyl isomerase|nr:peptidylprolyl isomerase [Candidatus Limnocylindria bacterium]
MRTRNSSLWVCLTLALASCRDEVAKKRETVPPEVVAVVGTRSITKAALERELQRRGPEASKDKTLEELVQFEATLAKVRTAGFDRDPEIVAAVERMLVARFQERELATAESPVVTEDEIRASYAASAKRFAVPAKVRGGVLYLRSPQKADSSRRAEVAEQAEKLRAQAQSTNATAFARLVREHSDDQTTRYRGGDTGWLSAGQPQSWDPVVAETLLTLKQPGECASVVETQQGFYIIRLAESQPASVRPLAEVCDLLRHELQQAKRARMNADFQTRMRVGLDIQINPSALNQIMVTTQSQTPPPFSSLIRTHSSNP